MSPFNYTEFGTFSKGRNRRLRRPFKQILSAILRDRSPNEPEADGHAAAVAFHGGVQVAFAAAEVYDFVEFAGNLGATHAHDGAVHVDVLAAGHLRVEPGAHFEEARDAAPCADGVPFEDHAH